MNPDWLAAFIAFAFSTAGSPGPNNMMLAASGANFGLRRSVWHILGIVLGFPAMIAAVGLGAGEVLTRLPILQTGLKIAGSLYLLYLAWRIATAAPAGADALQEDERRLSRRARPLTFWEAAAFQWVNPKAWTMVIAMLGVYAGHNGSYVQDVLLMAGLFIGVASICATGWVLIGMAAARLLSRERLVWFNRLMALLLVASLALVWT